MIVDKMMEFLHSVAVGLFSWLSGHLPSPPTYWTDASSALSTLVGSLAAPVRYFLPVAPLVNLAIGITGLMVTLGLIRLARRVASLMTGGGGMA